MYWFQKYEFAGIDSLACLCLITVMLISTVYIDSDGYESLLAVMQPLYLFAREESVAKGSNVPPHQVSVVNDSSSLTSYHITQALTNLDDTLLHSTIYLVFAEIRLYSCLIILQYYLLSLSFKQAQC